MLVSEANRITPSQRFGSANDAVPGRYRILRASTVLAHLLPDLQGRHPVISAKAGIQQPFQSSRSRFCLRSQAE